MNSGSYKSAEWLRKPARALRRELRNLKNQVFAVFLRGGDRYCPCCGKCFRKFLPFGTPPRPDARCPRCQALERDRFLYFFLQDKTDLFDGRPKKILHVAAEAYLEEKLRKRPELDYLTADLNNPSAMIKMDITSIQFPDSTFDVIICNHVLEHVPDDRSAMREIRRILKKDGWAILNVPIVAERTFEDPRIVTPAERLRVHGHVDHIRSYGHDYADRLAQAGLIVITVKPADLLTGEQIILMGLAPATGDIFMCRRN